MKLHTPKIRIGLRTIKTVIAVILSMIIVDHLGATSSKLIFAMLGAMAAVQPTFKESLDTCIAQIIGVILGALIGVLLLSFIDQSLLAVGIGMVVIITVYNISGVSYSPSLPCFILVMLCTTEDVAPFSYALGRIWDTAIGLAIGFVVNILIFPYDPSKGLRVTVKELTASMQYFLEDLFDGDDHYPTTTQARQKINRMANQLKQLTNQKLLLHLRHQKKDLELFHICDENAKLLLSHIEILHDLGKPGGLDTENQECMKDKGFSVADPGEFSAECQRDILTNYHVKQLLKIHDILIKSMDQ